MPGGAEVTGVTQPILDLDWRRHVSVKGLVLGPKHLRSRSSDGILSLASVTQSSSMNARNLGLLLDQDV